MSKVGYKYKATLYTLNDEKIQVVKCKRNGRRNTTSGFVGSGILSGGQTLNIATKDKLDARVVQGMTRCKFKGHFYLIVSMFTADTAPIKNEKREINDTILVLQ